jgi:membrane protease YdiL (CAAX protease family)
MIPLPTADRRPTRPGATVPGATGSRPGRRRGPRWGSVAHRQAGGSGLSTAPGQAGGSGLSRVPGQAGGPGLSTVPGVGTAVLAGGLAFLLGRPALGGSSLAVPLLAVGYLVLLGGALAAGERGERPQARAPLGWGVALGVGVIGVALAGVAGGPVADRRVGALAGGLAVLAGVAEEALFRRLLYDRLLRFGVVTAVAGTAVVFALVHLPAYGLVAMPVDLGAALLLSWQRYASGRWTVPAVTHAVANLLAVT